MASVVSLSGERPGDRRRDQLQVRDEAGGQMHRADLGAVAELQHGRDQADHDGGEQFIDAVQFRVGDVTEEEAEVERGGQQHEEAENHLLQVHAHSLRARSRTPALRTYRAPERQNDTPGISARAETI
jgi:hypothetical protein